MDQKCNIANREVDELREEIKREKEEAERNCDNLRVSGEVMSDSCRCLLVCVCVFVYLGCSGRGRDEAGGGEESQIRV